MNADMHIELAHATVASAALRELVHNVAAEVLDRIGQAREVTMPDYHDARS